MNALEKNRLIINEADDELVKLFEKRNGFFHLLTPWRLQLYSSILIFQKGFRNALSLAGLPIRRETEYIHPAQLIRHSFQCGVAFRIQGGTDRDSSIQQMDIPCL